MGQVGRSCGDPGVWVLDKEQGRLTDRKLCAVGVRVTRGVGSHGIGLNVLDAPIPEGLKKMYSFQDPEGRALPVQSSGNDGQDLRGYLSWGFGRIVACGLEGKKTTWLTAEGADAGIDVHKVANVFARELAKALNAWGIDGGDNLQPVDGVEEVTEDDLLLEGTQSGN